MAYQQNLLYKDLCYDVVGAAMAVHRTLGCGFLEKVYQESLAIELADNDIPFEREKPLKVNYKGHELQCDYFCDFLIDGLVIVELKAVDAIESKHRAQILNYLHATGLKVGLLINFGAESLEFERIYAFDR